MKSKSANVAYWQLLLCWTVLVIVGDLISATTTWRQRQAMDFPTTTAKIAQSRQGQGALGHLGLMLRYTYSVDGKRYTGHRYRYDVENVSLRYASVVGEYHPLSLHTVYYNPRDPADSVLSPGVEGSDWLVMLAVAPINIATFAIWLNIFSRRRKAMSPQGGFQVFQDDKQVRVRMTEMTAFAFGACALAGAAAMAASIMILFCGVDAPPLLVAEEVLACLVVGLAAGVWKHVNNNSGRFDLFAAPAGQLTLPATAGRREPMSVAWADLSGVTVQRRSSKIPSGMHYSYLPALALASPGGPARVIPLVTWGWDEQRALAFGHWLSDKLNARFIGVEDEVAPVRAS